MNHKCLCGCGRDIEHGKLSCPQSWNALPREVKRRVWTTQRYGLTGDHLKAVATALDIIRIKRVTP